MICDSTIADNNSLLNSEVRCATALMTGRLRLNKYERHRIVPVCTKIDSKWLFGMLTFTPLPQVFIYSISAGRKVRVVQAHYDEPSLVIRKSKLVDLERENVPNLKCILRWVAKTPIGDTEWRMPTAVQRVEPPPAKESR